MIEEFEALFGQCSDAFKQSRTAKRGRELAYGLLNCMGRRTITGMLTGCGQQFQDWTAAYRLFDGDRMDIARFFSVIRKELAGKHLSEQMPIYAHMDDTNTRKRGRKVAGASWQRDPLGPPFHTNFIWGQRFIQLSISLPEKSGPSQSRAIPVDFHHCPPVKKPKKSDAPAAWQDYRKKQKMAKLSQVGCDRLKLLRDNLNNEGARDRVLITSVDGSYTNETVVKQLPENVILIGRVRKDCCLYTLPDTTRKGVGRNRVYGDQLPTPEQIRQSDDYPWQEVEAWAAGKTHQFDIKVIKNVRWRKAGARNLQLVVIRPLGYRLTKNSRILYREPAYLLCTDVNLAINQLLQAYLWRWEIEVNFRDEKTVLGCGQAQVRNEVSVEKIPAFVVAIYALLLLAAHKTNQNRENPTLPRAKWYPSVPQKRQTTGDILNIFRSQVWAKNANINFSHFVNLHKLIKNRGNTINPTYSAAFYLRN